MFTSASKPSNRILVVDDDPVVRHLISTIVKREGYVVVEANDGDQAYRILNRDADFRAAVLDMMMPGLNGKDLLLYMRSEKRLLRIPVMMITAEKHLTLMKDLFAAGATAVLPKPFSTIQIQTMLNMIINQQERQVTLLSRKQATAQEYRIRL